MNEIAQEVFKRADKIGDWLNGNLSKAADVATQQAIDIAMQYVAFGRVYHTSAIILAVLLSVLIIWLVVKFYRVTEGASVVAIMVLLAPIVIFCENFKDCILVWVSPKVWLITQIAALAKAH